MTERERTILLVGGLALGGLAIVTFAKGINQAEGNIGTGIANGFQSIFTSIGSDIEYVGIGAGIAALSIFLPPPIDVIGLVAALAVPVILYETSGSQSSPPDSTPSDTTPDS